jgi:hypothetical protein
MDPNLEKDITVTRLKSAALIQRTKGVLALAELVSEYVQLADIQQKQINALRGIVKAYEEKSVEPASPAVPRPPSMPAGRNSGPSDSAGGAGPEAVGSAEVERGAGEVPGNKTGQG